MPFYISVAPGIEFNEEEDEWIRMTPGQRFEETTKLWATFLMLGGSLDPEPDSQSPFYFREEQRQVAVDRRSGVYSVRRPPSSAETWI